MAYNNNWSITEIAGISDLRDSYQWNGEKRLWKWLLLRRINNYSSSNAGRTGTVISNTTPSANSIPQAMTDTAIQKSATRYGGGIRYYAIPGFLANGQNIIALGGANVEHAAREQAYNHVSMTWDNARISPSEIKNWSYFNLHQYPTILLECENFSIDSLDPLFSVSNIEDFYTNPNKIFLSESNEPLPRFVAYCSPQADFYLAYYHLTSPTINNTIKATTLSAEIESNQLVNMVVNWNATTNITGDANVNFGCYKVKSGYNRIPTQSIKRTQGIYELEISSDKEKVFVTIRPSIDPSDCVMESDYFYLEPGKYYYVLDKAISGNAVLSGVISDSLTTSWKTATVNSGGFVKFKVTYPNGGIVRNQEIRPILILSTNYPNAKWDDVCVVNNRPNFIKDSLFYLKNTALKRNTTNTYTITATLTQMDGWPGYQHTLGGYRWGDLTGPVGHTVKFNTYYTFNMDCNRQRLIPWCINSTYSEIIDVSIDAGVNRSSNYGSWTVYLPDGTQPRTFNKTNYAWRLYTMLPFTPISSTDVVTSGEIVANFSYCGITGRAVATNTDLCSIYSPMSGYDTFILIASQLYHNDFYISEPQCPIIFDEKPAVYFVKHSYLYFLSFRYSYKPYWGANQISTDTYLDSTLSITFYSNGVKQTVDFPVPTPTGSTTATVNGKTLTWYGPQNSTHPGEIVHPDGFSSSCSLSPYNYGVSSMSGGIQVTNRVGTQSRRITGEVKATGDYLSFTLTEQRTPGTVTTDDGTYTLQYLWAGDTLYFYKLTSVHGSGEYTVTDVRNVKFYKN